MLRHISLFLSPLILPLLVGCSPYVDGYYYVPRPAVAEIYPFQAAPPSTQPAPPSAAPAQPPPPAASTLVSVVGIFRGDRNQGIPESVQVRFRVENRGNEAVTFQPQTLELIDGSLVKYPPPLMQPPQMVTLAPNQATIIDAYFPFPPGRSWGNTDLGSLRLSWITQVGSQNVSQGVDFRRIYPGYYYYRDPYWGYPGPFVGVGGVFVIRHR